MSGPLVTGQTRISSSLASMDRPCYAFDERRINTRPNRQIPQAPIGECATFYRILLGHQDSGRAWKFELFAGVAVMIRESVAHRSEAEPPQKREKACRITDACDGVDHAATPRLRIGLRIRVSDVAPWQCLVTHRALAF